MASSPFAAAVQGGLALWPVPPSSRNVARNGGVAWRAVAQPQRRRVGAAAALDDLRPAINEYPEGILSGKWPENFSLLSYADLRAYLESQIVTTDKMSPTAKLGDVMSRPMQVATVDQKLANIDTFFAAQSGLPVLDEEGSIRPTAELEFQQVYKVLLNDYKYAMFLS
ncbi:hypothetical protein E2562_006676 [Oryza meyeriana var. granulata]|uniref:CBS domain-containing protein n=1 Tax=Oryza meyeriana var. granulata TaxID=110450 RepID=A0A6G1EIB7_9ORYZ|nr:hypothetical protein E2562_006676 [Oryza meyeriana var. granulata]